MNTIFLTLLTFFINSYTGNDHPAPDITDDQGRFCYVYGTIAIVDDPRKAHFKVYVEETEGLADLIIYEEEISLYADRQGIWHFMENPGLADYVIYLEESKYYSDFSIYYTDIESFARCNN